MSGQQNSLFPSLGDVASRTEALPDVQDDDKRLAHDAPTLEHQEEGEEREVQEIESLCMRCHENVRLEQLLCLERVRGLISAGHNEIAPHHYPLLQGDRGHVFPM